MLKFNRDPSRALVAVIFFITSVFVNEKVFAQEVPIEKPEMSFEQKMIKSNIAISEFVDDVAEGIDLFLTGKRITNKKNKTSVRVENVSLSEESKGLTNSTNLNVNLRLPNLEHYWQLKFTTYDEETENRGVQNAYLRKNPRERNYGATLGFFRKLGNIRTAFQPRVELQNPLKISHSLSFESVAAIKWFEVRPKLEFYANPSKGTGIFFGLNFNQTVLKGYSLTYINDADYEDKSHLFSVSDGISLGHAITDKKSMAYTFLTRSINQPHYHLDGYNFSVAWSQLIYKNILDYQVVPNLDFAKVENFRGRVGLTLSLNLNF